MNNTFILFFITFLKVYSYVSTTLYKYNVYSLFKFLIIFIIFGFDLYYTAILKLIINKIIIIYICLTQTVLYFFVNVVRLLNAIFYAIKLIFKTFL